MHLSGPMTADVRASELADNACMASGGGARLQWGARLVLTDTLVTRNRVSDDMAAVWGPFFPLAGPPPALIDVLPTDGIGQNATAVRGGREGVGRGSGSGSSYK